MERKKQPYSGPKWPKAAQIPSELKYELKSRGINYQIIETSIKNISDDEYISFSTLYTFFSFSTVIW